MVKTVRVDGGKYEFDVDDYGRMVAARRHGVEWPAGLELRFTKCFVATLVELQAAREQIAAARTEDGFHAVLGPVETKTVRVVYDGREYDIPASFVAKGA